MRILEKAQVWKMTSRGIMIEQVRNKLAGGKAPANFPVTLREAGKLIDQIANEVIKIECKMDLMCGEYCIPYESISIKKDDSLNKYYCDLPAKVLGLDHQKGVWSVSSMKDQSTPWVRITTQGAFLYKSKMQNLLEECGEVPGYYYQPGAPKLFFEGYDPAIHTDNVLIKLVSDRSSLDDEDDYCIPADMENIIIDRVFQKFNPSAK